MKIRIKGNSIRFRLTKTNVADFGRDGFLEEKTEFPNGSVFHYRLERMEGIPNLQAAFTDNCICVYVPNEVAAEWELTDAVGYQNTVESAYGNKLFLLIEKDFVCLDHTLEDQSDNYPNPNKAC